MKEKILCNPSPDSYHKRLFKNTFQAYALAFTPWDMKTIKQPVRIKQPSTFLILSIHIYNQFKN